MTDDDESIQSSNSVRNIQSKNRMVHDNSTFSGDYHIDPIYMDLQ
jgi:hypothetical protein